MRKIEVTLTADSIPENISADISIIIDVLRASSVIVTALANNTPYIIPALSVDEAFAHKTLFPSALLAGERNAIVIDGFDLGNSPRIFEQTKPKQALILTTTNGTKALSRARNSKEIIIATFLNVNEVAKRIDTENYSDIHIACAGTNGKFSMDDYLMAGAIISRVDQSNYEIDDAGLAACLLYETTKGDLHKVLCTTYHYKVLQNKGFQADLNFCLRENIYPIIPEVVDMHPLKLAVRQK